MITWHENDGKLVFRAWQRNIILYWHACQKKAFVVIHDDRFIGQGAYTAEKRVSCQMLLWPDSWFWLLTIWFGTVMMSLIIQNVAAACWICCSSWRRKVWGTWQPHQCHSMRPPTTTCLAIQESPYDEATIVWMVHVRKWLLTSFRNETSGEDGNTMLGRILQLSNFFPNKSAKWMIRKLDWILQSETGWQKFTQKTKRQPEKILSDFKRLLVTNAAVLGKTPRMFPPPMPQMIQVLGIVSSQNSDILGICFCSKQVYI